MSQYHSRRILAIEVRGRAFGFAFVDGPEALLDCGVKAFRGGVNAVRVPPGAKIANLLGEYVPEVILIRVAKRAEGKPVAREVSKAITRYGSAEVRPTTLETVRRFFAPAGRARNKHERAVIVAQQFPEIAWRLPPKRKPWQREDQREVLFDAVALALTYFGPARVRAARAEQSHA